MNEIQPRHDGFSADSKRLFLVALRAGETVLSACALVGISNRTAYNHRDRDPAFARDWRLARQVSRLPLELAAYQRGVIGVEEPLYAYGRRIGTRVHHSDALLRTLLAGEKPGKYGRRAGMKADRKWLKRRIDERVAAETEPLRAAVAAALAEVAALRTSRNSGGNFVNFVNPLSAGLAPSARTGKRGNWRLAAARRHGRVVGISSFSRSA